MSTKGDALTAGYGYLEVRCLGCDTHQTVAIDVVRRPKTTPTHELEQYMRCKDCSQDHLGICWHLGSVFKDEEPAIALLPRFSRLADAGVAAMEVIARSLGGKSQIPLTEVASSSSAKRVCAELHAAARDWPTGDDLSVRHIETAHRFANAIRSADTIECFTALLQHHEIYGGGLRWFVLRSGRVEPRMPPLANTSGYRFRLWSLCRVATQCRVIKEMPAGLHEEAEELED